MKKVQLLTHFHESLALGSSLNEIFLKKYFPNSLLYVTEILKNPPSSNMHGSLWELEENI